MSEVRGNCRFCADFNHSRVHPPCDVCTLSADRPHWSPSATGRVALRLEADNAALRAQVQRVREAIADLRNREARGDDCVYTEHVYRAVCEAIGGPEEWGAFGDAQRMRRQSYDNAERIRAALNGEPDTYGIATDGEYDAETPVGDSTHNTPTPDPRPRLTPFAIDALRGRERYGTNDYDGTLHCHDGCYRQLRAHREDPEVPTDG